MSFTPLNFTYNPPPTVETGIPTNISNNSFKAAVTSSQLKASSKSTALKLQLASLQETNAFLQQLILNATVSTVIKIDPAIDVSLTAAAQQVYGQIPPGISIAMYSNLLDAELASQVLASNLDGTANQVNPSQLASIMTLTTGVDNALLDNVTFTSELPLLLRSLKVDSIMFQGISSGLNAYPIQTTVDTSNNSIATVPLVQASSLDISQDLSDFLNGVTSSFANNYASVYNVVALTSAISGDLQTLQTFQNQEVSELVTIVALTNGAKGLVYKDVFKDLHKDLGNFVYARLVIEATTIIFAADKLTAMAIDPIKQIGGNVSKIISQVNAFTKLTGVVPNGSSLAGISKANSCCQSGSQSSSKNSSAAIKAGTNSLSEGLTEAVQKLNWLESKITTKINHTLAQFKKVLGRRLGTQQSHTNLLCSLKSAEALVNVCGSIINQSTGMTTVPPIATTIIPAVSPILTASTTVQTTLISGGVSAAPLTSSGLIST